MLVIEKKYIGGFVSIRKYGISVTLSNELDQKILKRVHKHCPQFFEDEKTKESKKGPSKTNTDK